VSQRETNSGIRKDFPSDEQFGLTVQLRRAAAFGPTNIAFIQKLTAHVEKVRTEIPVH